MSDKKKINILKDMIDENYIKEINFNELDYISYIVENDEIEEIAGTAIDYILNSNSNDLTNKCTVPKEYAAIRFPISKSGTKRDILVFDASNSNGIIIHIFNYDIKRGNYLFNYSFNFNSSLILDVEVKVEDYLIAYNNSLYSDKNKLFTNIKNAACSFYYTITSYNAITTNNDTKVRIIYNHVRDCYYGEYLLDHSVKFACEYKERSTIYNKEVINIYVCFANINKYIYEKKPTLNSLDSNSLKDILIK